MPQNSFLQGAQVGLGIANLQENRRSDNLNRDLRYQELKSQDALRRVHERVAAQELELKMQRHAQEIDFQANMAKGTAAYAAATAETIPFIGPPELGQEEGFVPNPNRMSEGAAFLKFIVPAVANSPYAKDTPEVMSNFVMNQVRKQTEERRAKEAGFQPSVITVPDDKGGDPVRFGITSPRSAQVLPQPKNQLTEQERAARAKTMGLEPSGLNAEGEANYSRPQGKRITRLRPDGTTEIIEGATSGDLNAADRSDLRQRTIKLEDTARRIQPLIENADKIFGAKALAGTVIVDRALANLSPNLVEGQRVQGRAAARYAFEGLIRSLTEGQGALSNQDVKRIRGLFPELGNVEELLENPARSKQILKSLQKQLARDASTDARMLGESPTPEVLRHADPAYLLEEFRAKRITSDQFREAINKNVHQEDAKALLDGM